MRYDAFISYRHAELDTYVAKKIHKMLEIFKVPGAVKRKSGKKKIQRVFRDQEELPIGSSLTNNIEAALQESEFLIVICSPRTPQSEWVAREIDTFIQMHDRHHVLAVLIEGEPNESFPPRLLVDEEGNPVEPLAADVRGANYKEVNSKLKTEVVRLAAPLLYCSYDDLRQRHRERRMRKMAAVFSGVAVLGIAFGVYSTINANLIRQNYQEKLVNQSKYLAETSTKVLEAGDRKTAAMIALEALGTEDNDRPFVPQAQYALTNALHCYELGNRYTNYGVLSHDTSVIKSFLSYDGKYAVSVDMEKRVYLWDVEKLECLFKYRDVLNERNVYDEILAIGKNDAGTVIAYPNKIIWLEDTGSEIRKIEAEGLIDFEVSADGEHGVAVFSDRIQVVDLVEGAIQKEYFIDMKDGFYSSSRFSLDYSKLAVGICQKTGRGRIYVYDLETDQTYSYKVKFDYVGKMAFVGEDQLAAVSMTELYKLSDGTENCECQLFDFRKGKQKWSQPFVYVDSQTALSMEYNISADCVIFSEGHDVSLIHASNGELLTTVKLGATITEIKTALEAPNAYLTCAEGKLKGMNLETGLVDEGDIIEQNIPLKSMQSRGGYVMLEQRNQQELLLYNFAAGSQMKERLQHDGEIKKICTSPEEGLYAICGNSSETNYVEFYGEDDQLVYSYDSDVDDRYNATMKFISEDTFMIASMEGVVTLINPRENTSRMIAWEGISYSVEQYLTPDEKLLLMYNEEGFSVMDLEKQEFVRNKSVQEIENIELRYAVYDWEKDIIYGYSLVDGLVSIEAETGKVTHLDAEKYEMADLSKDPFYFGMDASGKRLFMVCWDGYLRVWDMEQQSTICEIPFDCTVNCFLKFTPDGSRIICMGDDYHLRVLNVEEQKYEYISTGQYWIVEDAQWSRDGKSILMHNSRELLILDAKTYEVLADVEDAELYLQKKNKIWCIHQDTIYEFPYMDVQMLVDEFKSQFGDAKLTEYQRVKYHVD